MRKKSAVPAAIEPLVDLFDTLPDVSLSDLDAPDLSVVTDVVADATVLAADTATVIGRHSGRFASRAASATWRHRDTVATVAVIGVVVLAIASIAKRSKDSDVDEI